MRWKALITPFLNEWKKTKQKNKTKNHLTVRRIIEDMNLLDTDWNRVVCVNYSSL